MPYFDATQATNTGAREGFCRRSLLLIADIISGVVVSVRANFCRLLNTMSKDTNYRLISLMRGCDVMYWNRTRVLNPLRFRPLYNHWISMYNCLLGQRLWARGAKPMVIGHEHHWFTIDSEALWGMEIFLGPGTLYNYSLTILSPHSHRYESVPSFPFTICIYFLNFTYCFTYE